MFLVIGLVMLIVSAGLYMFVVRRARAAQTWPVVRGRIRVSHVDGGFKPLPPFPRVPVLVYDYSVAGKEYSGTALYLSGPSGLRNYHQIEWFKTTYPVGAEVDVHYNPANPGDAALIIKSYGSCLFAIVAAMAVIFTLFGLIEVTLFGFTLLRSIVS